MHQQAQAQQAQQQAQAQMQAEKQAQQQQAAQQAVQQQVQQQQQQQAAQQQAAQQQAAQAHMAAAGGQVSEFAVLFLHGISCSLKPLEAALRVYEVKKAPLKKKKHYFILNHS